MCFVPIEAHTFQVLAQRRIKLRYLRVGSGVGARDGERTFGAALFSDFHMKFLVHVLGRHFDGHFGLFGNYG